MDDYIKRENAKRAVWGCARDTGIDEAPFEYAEGLLRDVPAEDVEPVVRCSDCLFCQMELYEGADEPWCDVHNKTVDTEAFCSWGERKNNGKID